MGNKKYVNVYVECINDKSNFSVRAGERTFIAKIVNSKGVLCVLLNSLTTIYPSNDWKIITE